MGKLIGYGKIGRSMPLTFDGCGSLGGDVEPIATLQILARRHPDDTFILVGRNTGETPAKAGLPENIINPWVQLDWKRQLDDAVRRLGFKGVPLTTERQLVLAQVFDDIVGPTFDKLNGVIMWVGQHGTSNAPIPMVGDPTKLTKPQEWCVWYAGFLLRGINRWRDVDPWNREEVWLNPDPRNYHKLRDLKWPLRHPILAQYDFSNTIKHHRYGDAYQPHVYTPGWHGYAKQIEAQTWQSTAHSIYSRLEIGGVLPGTPFGDALTFDATWERPGDFGLFINETRKIGVHPNRGRLAALRDWVLPLKPHFIHGTWSADSLIELGVDIRPLHMRYYNDVIHEVRCTFTTPSSGKGWATAKPWEAFAAGTVCFFHPAYDTQDNILGDADPRLREWLRVRHPSELKARVHYLSTPAGGADWTWLVHAQRKHYEEAAVEQRFIQLIEERVW